MGVSFLVNAAPAEESNGVISFAGELTDSTCKVDIEGQGPNATVILPTVRTSELNSPAKSTGRTNFNINLSDCVAADGKNTVAVYFQPGQTVNMESGRLINTNGDADNVELQLLDVKSNYKVINVGNSEQMNTSGFADMTGGAAILPYAVEYYATDKTTAGQVKSSVIYSLIYK